MDFELSEEQKIFQASARKFFKAELLPIVDEIESSNEFPLDLYKLCGKQGFLGINLPEEFGGSNADMLTCAILIEEASRINSGFGSTLWTASMVPPQEIIALGTEEQKEKYLNGVVTGDRIVAFSLTEPNAGSDTAGIRTFAKKDGDHYIVNGSKTFITNGAVADIHLLVAYTDKSKGHKGVDMFIVDAELPGVTVTKRLDKLGWHSSETVEIAYEDVRVPASDKLGSKGLGGALDLVNFGRIMMATSAVGLAHAAFEACLKYTQEREAFGRPISGFQVIKHSLAKMKMQIETARLLVWYACWRRDNGLSHRKESSYAKYHCGEMVKEVTSKSLQMFGGYGFMNEFPISRYFRDAQVYTIADGMSNIQIEVVAREIGLGRS